MRLSVKTKLTATFGMLLVLTIALGGIAASKPSTMNQAVDRALSQRVTMVQTAADLPVNASRLSWHGTPIS